MRRLAVFVEGDTDQAFMERLIAEVVGHNQVVIDVTNSLCSGAPWSITASTYTTQRDDTSFYVLIVNCGNDERVVGAINERYDHLVAAGYDLIIGMRDVLPRAIEEVDRLRAALERNLAHGPLRVELVLAVMELEAWFLGEVTHLVKLDHRLTTQFIERELGVDLDTIDIQAVEHPTRVLNRIYRLVGRRYLKGRFRAQQTLGALDFDEIYLTVTARAPALHELCAQLDEFAT